MTRIVILFALLVATLSSPVQAVRKEASAETLAALRDKAPNANLLLLREVQSCRGSAADPMSCIELMLLAAERDAGYHSYDEQQEGLPSKADIAIEARKLLLARYPDADVMIGLDGTEPVDPDVLLMMERAAPNILSRDQPGSGRLFNAMAQRLHAGGAHHIASDILEPITGPARTQAEKEYGQNSLEAVRVHNNEAAIGGLYYASPERVSQLEQGLKVRARILGADHIDTAVLAHNLAALKAARGESSEAIQIARQAHATLLAKAGQDDPRTITAALALADMLYEEGDAVQAASLARSAASELAKAAPNSLLLARANQSLARLDRTVPADQRIRLLEESARILEADDGSRLLDPLRALLAQAKQYPSGIFLVESDESKVREGNAHEIAHAESVMGRQRDRALANAYLRVARELHETARNQEAMEMARKAIALDPLNHAAKAVRVFAAINLQRVGESIDVMDTNDVRVMLLHYGQSGRALSTEVVEAHVMLGLSGMKANGPFGAVDEFAKAAEVVRQRLTARSNFDAKSRRDLETLRPVFRGQVMINFAAAGQLTQ